MLRQVIFLSLPLLYDASGSASYEQILIEFKKFLIDLRDCVSCLLRAASSELESLKPEDVSNWQASLLSSIDS